MNKRHLSTQASKDISCQFNGLHFDFAMDQASDDLSVTTELSNSILISLFTDQRALEEELPEGEISRKGWWAEQIEDGTSIKMGSKLWLLSREKKTQETLRLAKSYAEEALKWIVEEDLASNILVESEFSGEAKIVLKITMTTESSERYFQYTL
jgi:phage gp46-like protein